MQLDGAIRIRAFQSRCEIREFRECDEELEQDNSMPKKKETAREIITLLRAREHSKHSYHLHRYDYAWR